MTREEAIDVVESFRNVVARVENTEYTVEALDMALAALRPVSREQVEKAFPECRYCNEEWGTCNPITNRFTMPPGDGIRFCPVCGKPLTDEAVEMVMRRLEVLHDKDV